MRTIIEEPKRVVFMGTPQFAVPTLRALVEHAPPGRLWAAGLDITGVITRMDKPAGRGQRTVYSPVKEYALSVSLPVYQLPSLRTPQAYQLFQHLAPDVIIVAAFGQILPPNLLDLPEHGCLNVHASLLPRHRGASPVAGAILAGDQETGITIMLMEEGLDTGPIVAQRATPIRPDDTTGTLTDRLATLGARLLVETLPLWLAGGLDVEPQDESRATLTRPLRKEDGRLDWRQSAVELDRRVRAYTPWPGAFTLWNGQQVKILRAHPLEQDAPGEPGRAFVVGETAATRSLAVACGQGALALDMIQLEGKRAASSAEVLRGHPALGDAVFESSPGA
jgi:methionyl-tRNA formyltransferase